MKKVLLITDGIFHPPLFGRMALHRSLAHMDGFEFTRISSVEKLPGNLQDFSALIIYLHHKKISEAGLAALDAFVSRGGGILVIHSATASFKEQHHYFEILGGRFVGHGRIEPFEIELVAESKIFAGVPAFIIKDELYLHELQPGITVHFTTPYEGQHIPVVWTHQYGKGRVCYAVPGHRTETMRNETYQKVLQRGLAWVREI